MLWKNKGMAQDMSKVAIFLSLTIVGGVLILMLNKNQGQKLDENSKDVINSWANDLLKKWLDQAKKDYSDSRISSTKLIFSKENKSYFCTLDSYIIKNSKDEVLNFKGKKEISWDEIPDAVRASIIRTNSDTEIDFVLGN